MKKSLTIGFEAKRLVKNATGLGNYSRTLIQELALAPSAPALKLFVPNEGRKEWYTAMAQLPQTDFILPRPSLLPWHRAWWRYTGMVHDVLQQRCDVFHGLSGELPKGLKKAGIPAIVTIHDLIFLRYPQYYHPIDVAIYHHKFRLACREATKIVAISERTKADIVAFGNINPDRISVIYQSCAPTFAQNTNESWRSEVLQRYGLKAGYVLSVGSIEERKNALLLVESLCHCPEMRLVLVGRRTPYTDFIEKKAREWQVTDRLTILQGVPSADLPALYHSAALFAYPSRYEGFGIPIIEALSAGVPVVAATGSCLEEAGGEDQIYVSPDDVPALSAAIRRLLSSPAEREMRACAGKKYIQRFFGNQQAEHFIELYESIRK